MSVLNWTIIEYAKFIEHLTFADFVFIYLISYAFVSSIKYSAGLPLDTSATKVAYSQKFLTTVIILYVVLSASQVITDTFYFSTVDSKLIVINLTIIFLFIGKQGFGYFLLKYYQFEVLKIAKMRAEELATSKDYAYKVSIMEDAVSQHASGLKTAYEKQLFELIINFTAAALLIYLSTSLPGAYLTEYLLVLHAFIFFALYFNCIKNNFPDFSKMGSAGFVKES